MPADICMHPWKYYVQPFRIAGNLYYVGNSDVSSHLMDTGQGLILLDTAYPQTVYLLLESIRRLGFDPDDIRLILHCHGHYDHFGGTRALVELTGAKTALGEEDIEILKERPDLSWAPEYGLEFYETWRTDYVRSLQRLKKRPVDVFIGAHPGQNATLAKRALMTDGSNPFLDKTAWPMFLETLEQRAKAELDLA